MISRADMKMKLAEVKATFNVTLFLWLRGCCGSTAVGAGSFSFLNIDSSPDEIKLKSGIRDG